MNDTNGHLLHRTTLDSPIGRLVVAADDEVVVSVTLPGSSRRRRPGDRNDAAQRPDSQARGLPEPLSAAVSQLREYFAGRRQRFELPIALSGTDFQCQVWSALAEIPYGSVVSYAELAEMVGRPTAFRAVGQANGANPLPVVLPCHRVVASGGRIGGYGGGLGMKRRLLALEGVSGF